MAVPLAEHMIRIAEVAPLHEDGVAGLKERRHQPRRIPRAAGEHDPGHSGPKQLIKRNPSVVGCDDDWLGEVAARALRWDHKAGSERLLNTWPAEQPSAAQCGGSTNHAQRGGHQGRFSQ